MQTVWADTEEPENDATAEYYRLLNLANEGAAEDKLALFSYTAEHSDELGKYTTTALEHLVDASTDGNGQASFWIGHMAENGIWMDKNDQGALFYFILSAQQGFDKGMLKCVYHFAAAARQADSDEEASIALRNADKWYEALWAVRDTSEENFRRARYSYAVARLDVSSKDEHGWTLIGEAAIDGHEDATSLIREFFADASSANFDDDEDAKLFLDQIQPTIDIIGTTD